jgi:gamma-glutamylcyclotransferase (GGCT)/AIG2-like uncharacterized protein YtfP
MLVHDIRNIKEEPATTEGPVRFHKLFVYGTLKREYGNNRLLANSEFVGSTKIDGFVMFGMGGFPGVFKVSDMFNTVYGEVFDVNDTILADCDRLEGIGRGFYSRVKAMTKDFGEVWLYSLPPPETDYKRVVGGTWKGPIETNYVDVRLGRLPVLRRDFPQHPVLQPAYTPPPYPAYKYTPPIVYDVDPLVALNSNKHVSAGPIPAKLLPVEIKQESLPL